jgi:hypothetical protein
VKITRLRLTKEKLAKLPEKDRRLLIILGGLSNEINTLQKLMMLTRIAHHGIVDIVEAGQVMFFLRILSGKLHESRLMLDKLVTRDKEFKDRHQLDSNGSAAASLKLVFKHFNEWGALLCDIRDETFHSNDKLGHIERAFQALPATEPWDFFLSESLGNSFYYASELVMTRVMIDMTKRGAATADAVKAENEALMELHDAAIKGARLMADAFHGLMISIVDSVIEDLEHAEEDIPDGPRMSTFHLPYFFDMTGMVSSAAPETHPQPPPEPNVS